MLKKNKPMKSFYLILVSVLLLSFVVPLNSISYKIIKKIEVTNLYGKNKKDVEPVIIECLNKTTKDLTFKLNSNSSQVEKTKIGNCIGYTKYFNKMLISKLDSGDYGNIVVTHVRAKVLMMGKSVHVINSNSLKDHDISVIYDKTNNKTYFVDPSLSEVFGNIIIKQ